MVAVDNSRPALDFLAKGNSDAVASGKLKIVEADVAAFIPEAPADLVLAVDILPYIDPAKFIETWKQIHDLCVKEDGFLAGNFFRTLSDPEMAPMMNLAKEMGAWFLPDRRMVRPLLTHAGYEVKTCRFRDDFSGKEPMAMQFVAQKKTQS